MHRTILTLSVAAGCAASASADVFSEWNLVVRNNLHITSEVDGSAMVGGTVKGTSNYAVQGVTSSTGEGLAVGGDLHQGGNYQINNGGNLSFGGSVLGNANLNGGGFSAYRSDIGDRVADAMAQAQSLSDYFAGFSPTGSVDSAGNMNATTTEVNGQRVAVYSINPSNLNGLGQLNLSMGNADSVIINFDAQSTGGVANFNGPPNLIGDFSQANASRIAWNFINTQQLKINNSFNGMILATDANLVLTGGGINGSVFVDNVATMNAEVRFNTYNGLVPAPGTIGLLAGTGLVIARRRRTP